MEAHRNECANKPAEELLLDDAADSGNENDEDNLDDSFADSSFADDDE